MKTSKINNSVWHLRLPLAASSVNAPLDVILQNCCVLITENIILIQYPQILYGRVKWNLCDKYAMIALLLYIQVPFLTAGADDVGYREVKYEGCSELTGAYVIEDVQDEDKGYYRRLLFRSNINTIQTQARLVNGIIFICILECYGPCNFNRAILVYQQISWHILQPAVLLS